MNKITNFKKDLKKKVILNVGPPLKCRVCGYDTDKMKEEYEVAWLEHRIPNTSFVFYMCPNCNVCSGNKHSTENAKKIKEQGNQGESRILTPQGNIILPGQN